METILKIDLAKAVEMLDGAVAEKGADYVYPVTECLYVLNKGDNYVKTAPRFGEEDVIVQEETVPGCIVGLAMYQNGITLAALDTYGDAHDLLASLSRRGLVEYTPAAAAYMKFAQMEQDNHKTWGTAVASAKEMNYFVYRDKF